MDNRRVSNEGKRWRNSKLKPLVCLENLRDRGAWWAVVYGVAQSRTRLKRLRSSSSSKALVSHPQLAKPILVHHKLGDSFSQKEALVADWRVRVGVQPICWWYFSLPLSVHQAVSCVTVSLLWSQLLPVSPWNSFRKYLEMLAPGLWEQPPVTLWF